MTSPKDQPTRSFFISLVLIKEEFGITIHIYPDIRSLFGSLPEDLGSSNESCKEKICKKVWRGIT